MSNLFEDTPQKELFWLLRQIREREIALPDFQRDFVWDPSATQELITSIANNYPAGSLLAIRNTHEYFASREFEGAPSLDGHKPTYLILDGQQRLTSLYQAFWGTGEYLYFIRLKNLINGQDFDEAIFHVRANARRGWQAKALKRYSTLEGQSEDFVLPLNILLGDPDGFQGWVRRVARNTSDLQKRNEIEDQLDQIREKWIVVTERYKFPVVLLSDQTPPDAVCTIFETLNRTGVKLSVFDLLAARFWPENVKLRDMWESATNDNPIIQDYAIDPYYILQSIALLRPQGAPSCKRKDVLSLSAEHVRNTWDRVVQGLAFTLTILRDDCGVLIPKWLPYNTMLIPMTAVLANHLNHRGLEAGSIRKNLVRWFWCSVFSQAYENAPNSQAAKDTGELELWFSNGKVPETVTGFSFKPMALYEVTPKQRAVYRGVIALILSQNPRDFQTVKPLTRGLLEENMVDDHHIFPDAHLRNNGIAEAKRRDCVLNRTLIDRATNQSLSKRSPKDYFGEIRSKLGDGEFEKLLQSHVLPVDTNSPLLLNDFEGFLKWRCTELSKMIEQATAT